MLLKNGDISLVKLCLQVKKIFENILNIYILENKVPTIKRELNLIRLVLPDLEGCENLILVGYKK